MALRTKKGHRYGENHADIRAYLTEFSLANTYEATQFADCACATCQNAQFIVGLDEDEGVATRTCAACAAFHPIGDSADFLDEAEPQNCQCPCGGETFEASVGVALYADSEDVKWFYLGLRCAACELIACYGEWKNEFNDYRALLAQV